MQTSEKELMKEIEAIQFEEKELKNQLIPVLRKQAFRNNDWLRWTNQLLSECRRVLNILFPLSDSEQAFL